MSGVVTVVVVAYNSARDLPACLAALAGQTLPRHRFEVVVVDNASTDGSAALVRRDFPNARVVASRRNLGFAGGNNLGVTYARGDRVALLNPDTIADPHWLEELLRAADANPADTACSKLVLRDAPGVINSTGLTLLRDGRGADRDYLRDDAGQAESQSWAFAGCGAAVLLPIPERGPLFDPRLFLYCEDLDCGWRDWRGGGGPVYAPRSVVRHAVGAATPSPTTRFYAERNRALVALKNGDAALAYRCALTLAAKVPLALMKRDQPAAVARAFLSYLWHAPAVLAERLFTRPRS